MIKGKKIAIFGYGIEGQAAFKFLQKDNEVSIFDDDPQVAQTVQKFTTFDLIVRSPGVRPDHPKILKLKKTGVKTTTPTNLFFKLCPGKIIGVTGTKGKGTTATLIYEFLKTAYKNVYVAGNIGTPALEILPKLNRQSLIVLELSSFQLIDLDISPHIATVLMVTSEHQNWHKNVAEYRSAKQNIVKFQCAGDFAVINQDFTASRAFAKKTPAKVYFVSTQTKTNGVYVKGDTIVSQIDGQGKILSTANILLPGFHNLQNVVAAIAVVKILKVTNPNIAKILSAFKGLKHRLQLVRIVNGVKFYNDSISTTPETAIAAIEAVSSPKILILGGSSKRSDFKNLAIIIAAVKSIKAVILIGDEAPKIKKALIIASSNKPVVEGLKSMHDIVQKSASLASLGDSVLMSPACASFDMFKNYQDRGEQFIDEVNKL